MMKAVVFDTPGPPSVLHIGESEKPSVGPNDILIKVRATAVNRADTLQRKGLYPVPKVKDVHIACNVHFSIKGRIKHLRT